MMNIKNIVALVLIGFVFGCKKDEPTPVVVAESIDIQANRWIHAQMKDYYLWTDEIPAIADTDLDLGPDDYFYTLLNDYGNVDRFSWIQDDVVELKNSLNGKNTVMGVRTSAFIADAAQTRVALAVACALKGSPAEAAGIKRGDFITQINGVDITPDNYSTALSEETFELTLGELNENNEIVSTDTKLSITKEEVQTDAIQHYSIIEQEGKKIGYFVYLQFLTSSDDDMKAAFAEFKAAGVDELVLDFRFNGGGYISSSDILSSLIVPESEIGSLMNTKSYNAAVNEVYTSQYGANSLKTFFTDQAANLGNLERVFVITSNGTASASELIINNLKPYMDVILVGDHTYGKNVGSFTIDDEENGYRWKWGLQPITLITYNSLGEANYGTEEGFLPDYEVVDNVVPFLPFGDVNETLLKTALEVINGGVIAKTNTNSNLRVKKVYGPSNDFVLDNPRYDTRSMFVEKPVFK